MNTDNSKIRAEDTPESRKVENKKDLELVDRIIAGDEQALELLMVRWSRPVFSLALRILGSQELAEEVSQDVFLKVWRSAKIFETKRGAFSSWILTMTHHSAIDTLRRGKTRGSQVTQNLNDVIAARLSSVDEGISAWQRLHLEKALDKLTEAQKQVVEMAYFKGHTREEMAEILEIPVGTVKTRLRDAIKKLSTIFVDPEKNLKTITNIPA